MPRPVEGTSPYLPGLDGIRAIAVLSVILFHLNVGWASGGLLGVQVFFVLSGYLITDLLVSEYRRTRGIALVQFWIRRARRLLPALLVVLFVTVGWATLFDRVQLAALRSDLPSGLFYYSNWWFIFRHVSYFAKFGPPSPLGHLWSLSIEEQFYLIWPLLILVAMRYLHSRRLMLILTLAVAAASAVEMAVLYTPGGDPTRVYDGTDTRAFALLIGSALAMALPRRQTFARVTAGARRVLDAAGGAALLGIFLMFWLTSQYDGFLYEGGMVLLAVLTAALIAVTIHPASHLEMILGWEPLRWVGERSYGIYLWHYPVIVLTTPVDAAPSFWRALLQIAATLLLAALSWTFIEQPVRHGALARQWHRVRSRRWTRPELRPAGWALAAAVAGNAILCTLGLVGLVSASAEPASQVTRIVPVVHRPSSGAGPGSTTPTTAGPPPPGLGVTAIGDSLMVDAAPYLEGALPGIAIDAQVGQQIGQVQQAVPGLRSEGAVGDRLVVELGTNGPFTPTELISLLDSLGPSRRVVLVNTHVPRPWQQQVNDAIATVAQSRPNTVVVDWNTIGGTTPQFFYPDGVHLNPDGARFYAALVIKALFQPPAAARPRPAGPAVHGRARPGA